MRLKNPPAEPAEDKKPEQFMEEAMMACLTPALIKFMEAVLDFEARPEIAQKTAKGKNVLYDAFIAEGFTKEQAFQLILTHETTVPTGN